ncbi:MAG: hypothetical protein MJ189_03950 [Coriobacteriales bacterium]|nr:hypothetical protein [Coriobacteriales bacterium]
MRKSNAQVALKVISIIIMISAILTLILGLLSIFGGALLTGTDQDSFYVALGMDASQALLIFGIIIVVAALVDLFVGIFGVRGANNPDKIGPFYVISIIGVILDVGALVYSIFTGGFQVMYLIEAIFVIVCMLLAGSVRKQRGSSNYR